MALTALLALLLSVNAFAASPALDPGGSGLLTPAIREALHKIKAEMPQWTSVFMRVSGGAGGFYSVSESSLRINLNGRKDSEYFRFSGNAGRDFISISANPFSSQDPKRGYTLFGSGLNLQLNPSGSGYHLFGSVDAKHLSLYINRFGGGYSVWGQSGVNLNISGFSDSLSVSGQIDTREFGEKPLAVLGAALAVVNAMPAASAKTGAAGAVWKRYVYDGPVYRRNDCIGALQAVDDLVTMTDSRRGQINCSWNYGLRADWETLTPAKEGPVDAVWARATLQKSMGDLRACNVYVDTLDYMLHRLPVKNVTQNVYCNTGSSYISLSFDYLASAGR